MFWQYPLEIQTYNSENQQWGSKIFDKEDDFISFVREQFKESPDKYKLKNVKNFQIEGLKYSEIAKKSGKPNFEGGFYIKAIKGTHTWKKYWANEKDKVLKGVIIDNVYIPPFYYWYLNFCPIYDALLKRKRLPDVWDGDLWYMHYVMLAILLGKHVGGVKGRQKGYSYKHMAILYWSYCWHENSVNTVGAYDEKLVKKSWRFLEGYRKHINTYTAWKRGPVVPKSLEWNEVTLGQDNNPYGLASKLVGVTFKQSPSNDVGGSQTFFNYEEPGVSPTLSQTIEFIRPALERGSETTGTIIACGSVGELDDAEDLRIIFYNPDDFNFLSVKNIWDKNINLDNERCCIFISEAYNMLGSDKEGLVEKDRPFMDKEGNSDVEFSMKWIAKKEEQIKNSTKKAELKQLQLSQKCTCLDGDTLISCKGYTGKIKNHPHVIHSGFDSLYKITTNNYREILANLTHPIFNGYEYIKVKDLKVGDKIKLLPPTESLEYQKVTIKHNISLYNKDITVNEDIAWFLGMYMGDGCFNQSNSTYRLIMYFDAKDTDLMDKYDEFCKKYFGVKGIRSIIGSKSGGWEIRINDKSLKTFVESFELVKEREDNKDKIKRKIHVPEYIFKSPNSVKSSFLQGLFETDGYVSQSNRIIGFCTAHDSFMKEVVMLLSSFEIYPTVKHRVVTIEKEGRKYNQKKLHIKSKDIFIFSDKIGFSSARKKAILQEQLKLPCKNYKKPLDYSLDEITSIEYIRDDNVYDITTECGYFWANGLWVHNSPEQAFAQRSLSEFPVDKLKKQQERILLKDKTNNWEFKPQKGLFEEVDGKVVLNTNNIPPEHGYPINPEWPDKRGVWTIYEPPDENTEFFTYFAGVDAVEVDETATSHSVSSVDIFKTAIQITYKDKEGKIRTRIEGDKLVANYRGRFNTPKDTNHQIWLGIKLYNAFTYAERNKPNFINYMREIGKAEKYLAKESDVPTFKDLNIKTGNIANNSKFGFYKGDNTEVWKYFKAFVKEYFQTEYGRTSFTKNGEEEVLKIFTGIDRIDDYWLLEEFIRYIEIKGKIKGNYDRLVSFMAALFICKIYQQNRFIKKKSEIVEETQPKIIMQKSINMLGGGIKTSTSQGKKPYSIL